MHKIVESVNVIIDEELPHTNKLDTKEMNYKKEEEESYDEEEEPKNVEEEEETKCQDKRTPSRYLQKNHPQNLILGDKNAKT
jgi:hypothetical protein